MPLPYYVSPEQIMKDKAEYARKGISRGKAIVAIEFRDGVLLVAENPSTLLHKVSEIYDRIAFAGVGKYNEFRRYLKDNYQEALDCAAAVKLCVRALRVTQNKSLTERDLEVAVLD